MVMDAPTAHIPTGLVPVEQIPSPHWTIYMNRSGSERLIADHLLTLRLHFFLPVTVTRNGSKRTEKPAFPRYVFLCGEDSVEAATKFSRQLSADRYRYTLQRIPESSQKFLHNELVAVDKALTANPYLMSDPRIVKGVQVRITKGPLMGVKGQVIQVNKDRMTVHLNLTWLGASVADDFPAELIEICEE